MQAARRLRAGVRVEPDYFTPSEAVRGCGSGAYWQNELRSQVRRALAAENVREFQDLAAGFGR